MSRRAAATTLLVLLGLTGCSDGGPATVSLRDAQSWLHQGPVAVTVEGNVRLAGVDHEVAMTGEIDLAARTSHLATAGKAGLPERFEHGDLVIAASTLPDVRSPWTSFDERAPAVAAEGAWFLTRSREPSPLTALEVLATIDRAGPADEGGSRIVEVAADDVAGAFGGPAAEGLLVDCARGVHWRVWLDDGRLTRVRYAVDHAAISFDVLVTFGDRSAPVELPDGGEVFDATARPGVTVPGSREPIAPWEPCPGGDHQPTPVRRDCPALPAGDGRDDAARVGWLQVDEAGTRTPNARGRAWLSFADVVPLEAALDVPDELEVVAVTVAYPGGQGTVAKATMPLEPGATIDDLRTQIARTARQSAIGRPPADPPVAAVEVTGPWAVIAGEADGCEYWSVAPNPYSALVSPAIE